MVLHGYIGFRFEALEKVSLSELEKNASLLIPPSVRFARPEKEKKFSERPVLSRNRVGDWRIRYEMFDIVLQEKHYLESFRKERRKERVDVVVSNKAERIGFQ